MTGYLPKATQEGRVGAKLVHGGNHAPLVILLRHQGIIPQLIG